MDPSLIAEQPGGLYGWILQYGQVVAFIAQLIYWVGILVLLGYAVAQFKRWVNFQLGTGRSGALRSGATPESQGEAEDAGEEKPSVEEFVD